MIDKTWIEVYREVYDEVIEEVGSSVDVSVELSRRLFDRYEPVEQDGKRLYRFKPK